jgi:transposase
LTTKIHVIVDALGNPVAISLTPGQASDLAQAEPLLEEVDPQAFLADKPMMPTRSSTISNDVTSKR